MNSSRVPPMASVLVMKVMQYSKAITVQHQSLIEGNSMDTVRFTDNYINICESHTSKSLLTDHA